MAQCTKHQHITPINIYSNTVGQQEGGRIYTDKVYNISHMSRAKVYALKVIQARGLGYPDTKCQLYKNLLKGKNPQN